MPIHAPKILGLVGSEPLNVIGHHRDPQKAILCWNRAHMAILVEIGQAVRPGRVMKEPKKARKETHRGKLGVRPDHPC